MKKIMIFALMFLLFASVAYAADVAYVVKTLDNYDIFAEDYVTDLGYSVDVIFYQDVTSVDFNQYRMLLVGEGNFASYWDNIPVKDMPTLLLNTRHLDQWGYAGGVTRYGSSQPTILDLEDHALKGNLSNSMQVYTNGFYQGSSITIPSYYMNFAADSMDLVGSIFTVNPFNPRYVVMTVDPGEVLRVGVSNSRAVYFGAIIAEYWTSDSVELFENAIMWLIVQDNDGDGVDDGIDNCVGVYNPDQNDTDLDDIGDACDSCINDANNDIDSDGVCGDVDNCPSDANSDQVDSDGDGVGDVCDAYPNDADDDTIDDDVDNCIGVYNPDQNDTDLDDIGDACDSCINDANNDIDSDGVCGDVDNCPSDANSDQVDSDGDGVGDVCDDDTPIINDPPVIELNKPLDGFVVNDDEVYFLFNVSDDNSAVLDCSLYSDLSGVWSLYDSSLVANGGNGIFFIESLAEGAYIWNVECDDGSNKSFAESNYTFTVDYISSGSEFVNLTVEADTYMRESEPDLNRGQNPIMFIDSAHGEYARGFIRWSLANIPAGANILSANMYIYKSTGNCVGDNDIDVYYVSDDNWFEYPGLGGDAITWNNKPANDGFLDNFTVGAGGWYTLDVTNTIINEVDDLLTFELRSANEGILTCEHRFNVKEPLGNPYVSYIKVEYEGGAVDDAPSVVLLMPSDGAEINENNVSLDYFVYDAVNDTLSCNLYSDVNGTWDLVETQVVQSGLTHTFDVNSLAEDTYLWNVECSDDFNSAFAEVNYTFSYVNETQGVDDDNDTIDDGIDNCVGVYNPDQNDTDSDGIGDACDSCINDANNDIDSDGVCGDVDNCPSDANSGQEDFDSDGVGDVCDSDADGDGYAEDVDCDDFDVSINPGITEVCDDSIDNDCDGDVDGNDTDCGGTCQDGATRQCGSTDEGLCAYGTETCNLGVWEDCVGAVYPANETCDYWDNDCDGSIDEGVTITYYFDSDNDSFGDINEAIDSCTVPIGHVENNTDCDDTNLNIYPGATEIPYNGIDEDCSGSDLVDVDEDGYAEGLDCDDNDPDVNPGATEICDGIDNNCNNETDEGLTSVYYEDADNDSYGNPSSSTDETCTMPLGFVNDNTDCDDSDASVNPGVTEICDGIDNNCAEGIDEYVKLTFYGDVDSDGFGNMTDTVDECSAPSDYVDDNTDCDDDDVLINPNATEICDYVDNNCDGSVDEDVTLRFYIDSDSDSFGDAFNFVDECSLPSGYVENDTDCDDTNLSIYPGAIEVPYNGVDEDCSGGDLVDVDGDGYPYVFDCDDNDPDVNPSMTEILWNGKDDDCDSDTPDLIDDDDDGIDDTFDNCVDVYNPDQNDTDFFENFDGDLLIVDGMNFINGFTAIVDGADVTLGGGSLNIHSSGENESAFVHYVNALGTNYEVVWSIKDMNFSEAEGVFVAGAIVNTTGLVEITSDNAINYAKIAIMVASNNAGIIAYYTPNQSYYTWNMNTGEWQLDSLATAFHIYDNETYDFVIAKIADSYVIGVTRGDELITAVAIPVSEVRNSNDYFVTGDPFDHGFARAYYSVDWFSHGDGVGDACDFDYDNDGYDEDVDCDDTNASINPGMIEVPYNGVDDDCNENTPDFDDVDNDLVDDLVDNCVGDYNPGQEDLDLDGIGDVCDDDADDDGYTTDDCDDLNASINPGMTEIPYNGVDEDCSGGDLVDVDNDGYPYVFDCDDSDPDVNYGMVEILGDGKDNDCDGTIDEGFDDDGDGYNSTVDCDDSDPDVNPGMIEVHYNGVDDDCDISTLDYVDDDGDLYDDRFDCDDSDAAINPGATEVPYNGIDEDCSGSDLVDVDDDGYDWLSDCDDSDVSVNPGMTEIVGNGIDDDCDPSTSDEPVDNDNDGYPEDTDCDDNNPNVNPDMDEVPDNGIDDDCDGQVDEGFDDQDGDGVEDDVDNCPDVANPGQEDSDGDGIGDACDNSGDDMPVAVAGSDVSIGVEDRVMFDGTGSYDPDGYLVSYRWDFDDGTFGNGAVASRGYDQEGVYEVKLYVTDNDGNVGVDTLFVTVGDVADSPEDSYENNKVSIFSFMIDEDWGVNLYPGDTLNVETAIRNRGKDTEKVKLKVNIYGLGLHDSKTMDLSKKQTKWHVFEFEIPEAVEEGVYTIRLIAESEDERVSRHRVLLIGEP